MERVQELIDRAGHEIANVDLRFDESLGLFTITIKAHGLRPVGSTP